MKPRVSFFHKFLLFFSIDSSHHGCFFHGITFLYSFVCCKGPKVCLVTHLSNLLTTAGLPKDLVSPMSCVKCKVAVVFYQIDVHVHSYSACDLKWNCLCVCGFVPLPFHVPLGCKLVRVCVYASARVSVCMCDFFFERSTAYILGIISMLNCKHVLMDVCWWELFY